MGTHRREAEHLLYSVRSEYGEGFGKGLWALGAAEAARVTWERDLSEVQFPRPRAPRLLPGAMAAMSQELAQLGCVVPVHDGRPTRFRHSIWRTGLRTRMGDGVVPPCDVEVFRAFEDFVPASAAGLRWMERRCDFLHSCHAAAARSASRRRWRAVRRSFSPRRSPTASRLRVRQRGAP
jgi:hypothetical protein